MTNPPPAHHATPPAIDRRAVATVLLAGCAATIAFDLFGQTPARC